MDHLSELQDALPFDDDLFALTIIPPDRTGAVINLLSFPVEVLERVIQYCNPRSISQLMRVNRFLFSVGLRGLYACVYVCVPRHKRSLWVSPTEEPLDFLIKRRLGALTGLYQRPEYMASLRHLHLINIWYGEYLLHRIIQTILEHATSIQSLIFTNCQPPDPKLYDGVILPSTLKHIALPNFGGNLLAGIPNTAHLTSFRVTSHCITLRRLEALGEHWSSSLRQLHFTIHILSEDLDPSLEEIDEFASKFPHLNSLCYGYCRCCSVKKQVNPIKSILKGCN
jgi:hypothetical protein